MSDRGREIEGWRGWLAGPALCLGLMSLLALAAAPLSLARGVAASRRLLRTAGGGRARRRTRRGAGDHGLHLRRPELRPLADRPLIGVLLLGAGYILLPMRLWMRHAPAIHDITTDTADPPALIAPLAARAAEHGASAAYGGPAIAAQQQKAYPDIAPLTLPLAPAKAFDLALATARSMPRWSVTASDPATGRIEASQASFWFGFVDDVVIRVDPREARAAASTSARSAVKARAISASMPTGCGPISPR